MIEKKSSLFYKFLVLLSLLAGIILNIINTKSIISILSYYTLQSNILCLIAFTAIIISILFKRNYRKSEVYYVVKGGIVICILITAIM